MKFLGFMSAIFLLYLMNNCSLIFENENEASAVSFHENCLQNYTAYNIVQEQRYDSLYEVPVEIIILLSIFYGTISIVAVVGNFLVIWIVTTSRRMQNVTNCFIANLALADIVIGIFAIPFQFQAALLQRWHLPHFMCPFCPFVQVLSVSVSILTLTAIAIDRHKAILNPLRAYPSKFRAKVAIAGIWIVSFFIALPMALALRVDYIEYYDSSGRIRVKPFCYNTQFPENLMLWYRIIILLIQYIVPLCIISCVYSRMALRLWGSQAPGNAQCIRDATLMKNKKKVIKMLVIVVALFAFCWLPLQTYTVLQDIFPEINSYRYINIIFFCCDWLAMSNSCYNPFIYGIYNEKFKREFKQRFPFNKSHKWSTQSVLESTEAEKSFQPGRPSVRSSTTTVYYWKNNYSIRTTGRSIQSSNGGNYLVPPSCRTNGGGATKHRNSAVSRENSLRSEKEETYAVILKSNSQVTVGCCSSDIELEEHCL